MKCPLEVNHIPGFKEIIINALMKKLLLLLLFIQFVEMTGWHQKALTVLGCFPSSVSLSNIYLCTYHRKCSHHMRNAAQQKE